MLTTPKTTSQNGVHYIVEVVESERNAGHSQHYGLHFPFCPKIAPKFMFFWTSFGVILRLILGPQMAPKSDPKWDHFLEPSSPASQGSGRCDFAN